MPTLSISVLISFSGDNTINYGKAIILVAANNSGDKGSVRLKL